MKPTSGKLAFFGRIAVAALLTTHVAGHSWIEQLVNINDNGSYVGEWGYMRNFMDKGVPANAGAVQDHQKYSLPLSVATGLFITDQMNICNPDAQKPGQADKFPKLKTAPGNYVAMRYSENGHISQPLQLQGKPNKAGTNYVFATTNPKPGETLANVMLWTADGKGGDGNGRLLTAQTFDDGRCYEKSAFPIAVQRMATTPNAGLPLFCETDFQIPKDAKTGEQLTLYWVWQWPTLPGKDGNDELGKDEYYTSCMDVDIVDKVDTNVKPSFTLAQQDSWTIAVSDFKSRTALPSSTNPTDGELGTIFKKQGGQQTAQPTGAQPTGVAPSATSPAQPTGGQPTGAAPTTTGLPIPTITNRAGTTSIGGGGNGAEDVVTVTVTEMVTVTAPLSTATLAARAVPDEDKVVSHMRQHGNSAKFRGRV
ncbi:uncharacterized protein BDZ99DRAFT_437652 [Mytilinidion resinicola]|uniref:DUF7492 domain-containing protein n=1 Tax=Mytilinidion resinicola TaxID=574789 RepID=A0A6A6YYB4_9PEZI|nr:uncharacterized protein BDZ99DRAFT_437652 [Mytilinidion resinicola]KAF2812915.1 hypothetical protein BDZ99DRAFT_437652 [Mytilinidion resinicola]